MIFFTDKSNENELMKGKHYQMKHTCSATHCTLTEQQSLTSKKIPEGTSLSKTTTNSGTRHALATAETNCSCGYPFGKTGNDHCNTYSSSNTEKT